MDISGVGAAKGGAPAGAGALIPGYELTDHIDSGGMGAVYKAVQKSLNRVVAIKLLPGPHQEREGFMERFKREAEALARLNHPNIISVYDCGQSAAGQPYYVMEFVSGMDLQHLLRREPPDPRQIMHIISQVCGALQYAHEQGIVHRDIKPANILIDARGHVKVADFGLAKIVGPQAAGQTVVGTTMGTPDYIAPEVLEQGPVVDHRVDIYSLGVMIYEMFTGHLPKGRWDPPSVRCGTDKGLDALVSRALQNDPDKRHQSMKDMVQAVSKLQNTCDWRHYRRPPRNATGEHGPEPGKPTPSGALTVQAEQRPKAGRWARRAAVLVLLGGAVLAAAWQAGWLQGGSAAVAVSSARPDADVPASAEVAAPEQLRLAAWALQHGGSLNVLTPENMWQVEGPDVPVTWPPPLVSVGRAGELLAGSATIREVSDLPQGRFLIWRVSFIDAPLMEDTFSELVELARAAGAVSHLNLRGLAVPTQALEKLAGLPSLRSLDLMGSPAVTPVATPCLAGCRQLRLLRVGGHGSQVSDAMLTELRALLPFCGVHDDP